MKKNEKNQTHLIIKSFGYYVTGGNPIPEKGLYSDSYLYSDKKASAIKSTSKST